jgi:uncharacterized damage-inducible protein DinB
MRDQVPAVIANLLDELDANRAMFDALCVLCRGAKLDQPTADGGWTVGDHIAHIASYDQVLIAYLQPADDAPQPGALGSDAWNEEQVARRAGHPPETLRREMAGLREHSLDLLAALDDSALRREIHHSGDARREPGLIPLRLWLQRWSKHDMIHARVMLSALPDLATHPDFQSWLADDPVLEALQRQEGSPDR